MRELILERIETMREQHDGFRGTTRWQGYILTQFGLVRPATRKQASQIVGNNEGIRLVDSTNLHFSILDDDMLLSTYERMFRITCKQM